MWGTIINSTQRSATPASSGAPCEVKREFNLLICQENAEKEFDKCIFHMVGKTVFKCQCLSKLGGWTFFFSFFYLWDSDLGQNTRDLFFMVSWDVSPKPPPSQTTMFLWNVSVIWSHGSLSGVWNFFRSKTLEVPLVATEGKANNSPNSPLISVPSLLLPPFSPLKHPLIIISVPH